jgi:rare lipoprotein A
MEKFVVKKNFMFAIVLILFILPGAGYAAESQDSDINATITTKQTQNSSTFQNYKASESYSNSSVVKSEAENIIPADYKEIGYASWYGKKFHGKVTASGEPYDMDKLTAAHNYLPLGVKVKVTNLSNKKSVVVRINDRGPFVPERIIDLSRAAGEKIGILEHGKTKVRIEAYTPEPETTAPAAKIIPAVAADLYGAFYVQVGAFKVKKNADFLIERVEKAGFSNHRLLRIVNDNSQVFKVQIGMFKSLSKGREALGKLGKGFPGSFVLADVIQE